MKQTYRYVNRPLSEKELESVSGGRAATRGLASLFSVFGRSSVLATLLKKLGIKIGGGGAVVTTGPGKTLVD